MLKRLPAFAAALVLLVGMPAVTAKPIKTTSCETKKNQTIKKGGQTYTGCSCNVCKTTTCQTGGTASCSVETSRTCDCPETAARGGRGGAKGSRQGDMAQ